MLAKVFHVKMQFLFLYMDRDKQIKAEIKFVENFLARQLFYLLSRIVFIDFILPINIVQ
jgi:hypothetical protein